MFKPYVTLAVLAVTGVPSVAQFAVPGLVPALMRDPDAIAHGQWWRLVTALVVQDGGVAGTVVNLGFLAVLGHLAERALGPARWLLFYATGALAGETSGYLLGQPGAGNSVALCGLAAALAMSAAGPLERSLAAFYTLLPGAWVLSAVGGAAGVTGADGTLRVVLVAAVAAAGFQLVSRRDRLPSWLPGAVPVAVALTLTLLRDLHGVALLAGVIVGWLARGVSAPAPPRTTSPV
ncbi:rhomboid family intramembrane serine protease [Nonomuraea pusilla]|uniref:Rhomboid family protein n=1 Tax=Nonomuraea pusilla TaxID=46177 RepID=A0A1H8C3B7_9ACTN|nr:rhomboid family intramembrane serine protease [Nonomuraea pusilla]SEM88577.1 Rhomboid family protein [Nonomuraea pusilla]